MLYISYIIWDMLYGMISYIYCIILCIQYSILYGQYIILYIYYSIPYMWYIISYFQELSRLIHSHPAFAAHFLEISIESGDSFLNSKKTPAGVREAYQLFMEKFGHRGLCEVSLL